jgi:hypothetical protein
MRPHSGASAAVAGRNCGRISVSSPRCPGFGVNHTSSPAVYISYGVGSSASPVHLHHTELASAPTWRRPPRCARNVLRRTVLTGSAHPRANLISRPERVRPSHPRRASAPCATAPGSRTADGDLGHFVAEGECGLPSARTARAAPEMARCPSHWQGRSRISRAPALPPPSPPGSSPWSGPGFPRCRPQR